MTAAPHLLITPGEPAGIGPDLCVLLAQRSLPYSYAVVADPDLLQTRAALLQRPIHLEILSDQQTPSPHKPGQLAVVPIKLHRPEIPGKLDSANAAYVLECLSKGTELCLNRQYQALVTGPVHKGVINQAGFHFSGHTEFFAEKCGNPQIVMMLATKGLRVALVTTHLPLKDVANAIRFELVEKTLRVLHRSLLADFGIAKPNILVCGLNPHAGEMGYLGREEIEVIVPVLEKLRREGFDLDGPLPADSAFVPDKLQKTDAVLAMYHDQGLPVLKHMGFGNAVNVTLGLPFIRTSVDHGTALELAGTGNISLGSLAYAIDVALEIVQHRP